MVDLTVVNNSGGFHGHQLKDVLGGIAIAKIFGFNYVRRKNPYLDFFGVGCDRPVASPLRYLFHKKIRINGPVWNGLDYKKANKIFGDINKKYGNRKCLLMLGNAMRVHPCQTIKWYEDGLIKRNVFQEIVDETSRDFMHKNSEMVSTISEKGCVNVTVYINRGTWYDIARRRNLKCLKDPKVPRYFFPMSYYKRILEQLRKSFHGRKMHVHIYTEKTNSGEIFEAFSKEKDVTVHAECDRAERKHDNVYQIFYNMVESDVMVTCSSAFSVVATYFRKDGMVIYHPHMHLFDLPEDRYFATDLKGNFDYRKLRKRFEKIESMKNG